MQENKKAAPENCKNAISGAAMFADQYRYFAAFENVNFLCFGKRTLAYTIRSQYNKYINAISRNEIFSTFESG